MQMRRTRMVGLVVVALTAIPVPAHAHGLGGSSGFEIGLILLGLLLLGGALGYRARAGSNKTLAGVFVGLGGLLIVGSMLVPRGDEHGAPAGDVVVRILRPQDGAAVPVGEPVRIETQVTGADVARSASASDGGHLHIFVDGELQEMVFAAGTEVTLTRGAHTITVEYTNSQHLSFDPPIEESVEVIAR